MPRGRRNEPKGVCNALIYCPADRIFFHNPPACGGGGGERWATSEEGKTLRRLRKGEMGQRNFQTSPGDVVVVFELVLDSFLNFLLAFSLSLLLSIYLFIHSFSFLKKFLIIFNRVESVVFRINFSKSRMILLISNFRGNIVKKKEKRMDLDDDASTFPAHLFKVSSRKFDESIERYYSNHLPSPSIRVL